MMATTKTIRRDRVKVGDLAQHIALSYPPREVVAVDRDGGQVKIRYPDSGLVSGWHAAANFTFTREATE